MRKRLLSAALALTLLSAGADLTQRARAGVDPERSAAAGAGGGNAERLSGAAAPG